MERYVVILFKYYNFKQIKWIQKGVSYCFNTLQSLFD